MQFILENSLDVDLKTYKTKYLVTAVKGINLYDI